MSKDWKEELKDLLERQRLDVDEELGAQIYQELIDLIEKEVIAKQRTQLLKEVRELVKPQKLPTIVGICSSCGASRSTPIEPHDPFCWEILRAIILKKLKEIEEGEIDV